MLAGIGQSVSGNHHRRGDSLCVAGTAPVEPVALEFRGDVGWNGVEVRGERNAASASEGPHIGAAARNFLERDVPSTRNEPFRDEINRGAFGACGGIDGEKLRSQRDDVGHAAKLADPLSGSQFSGEHATSQIEELGVEINAARDGLILERIEQPALHAATIWSAGNRREGARDRGRITEVLGK